MVPKLYLVLSLVLGIGIGLIAPTVMAIAGGSGDHHSSGHGSSAASSHALSETRTQISRSATVETKYPPEQAIQLFTAEGEKYWLGDVGWNPAFLRGDGFSRNDIFAVGSNIFITTNYDAQDGVAEYARVQLGKTAGIVEVRVSAHGDGSMAEVTYNMASLNSEGDAVLAKMTDEAFAAEMANWQATIEANDAAIDGWIASRN
ncbi:MAG: hypothetical protein ACR2RE_09600 [Geminicoccaceae bacterium]